MRRTKEDAELTRQALLKAALRVFSRQGYAATRLEDVAQAARVTRGAIYHHFGGKAELYAALIEDAAQTANAAVGRAIQEGGGFLEIVRRVLVYSLHLVEEDAHFRAVMALLLLRPGEGQAQPAEQGAAQLEQVAGFFRMGREQGALRADLDPLVAARAFLAYQNGLMLLRITAPELLPLEQAVALADVYVHGIERG